MSRFLVMDKLANSIDRSLSRKRNRESKDAELFSLRFGT